MISTSISRPVATWTTSRWRTALREQRRVLDDGHLAGQLGQQPDGAAEHVVQVDGAVEEPLDRPPLGHRQRLDRRQPVDEEPVALVGGHPAGAGVRLGDVALLLEHRHVVADRGRGDAEVVPLGEGLAADRVVGRHVVLHDGPEDLQAAFVVRHGDTSPYRSTCRAAPRSRVPALALARTECQASIRPQRAPSRGSRRATPVRGRRGRRGG